MLVAYTAADFCAKVMYAQILVRISKQSKTQMRRIFSVIMEDQGKDEAGEWRDLTKMMHLESSLLASARPICHTPTGRRLLKDYVTFAQHVRRKYFINTAYRGMDRSSEGEADKSSGFFSSAALQGLQRIFRQPVALELFKDFMAEMGMVDLLQFCLDVRVYERMGVGRLRAAIEM